MTADFAVVAGSGNAWGAEHCNRFLGLLGIEAAEDHLLLASVAVTPDVQGLGVGRRLLCLAEERARAQGLNEVRLCTNVAMTEDLTYYPRQGYQETHRATQNGHQRALFTKAIRIIQR